MSLILNSNVSSLNAQNNLTGSQATLSTSLQRLSSGLRINKAADDAAGLSISQGLTAQIEEVAADFRRADVPRRGIRSCGAGAPLRHTLLARKRERGQPDEKCQFLHRKTSRKISASLCRVALRSGIDFRGQFSRCPPSPGGHGPRAAVRDSW